MHAGDQCNNKSIINNHNNTNEVLENVANIENNLPLPRMWCPIKYEGGNAVFSMCVSSVCVWGGGG